MDIIDKIKNTAKEKGISIAFICSKLGVGRGYLNDVKAGKNRLTDDRLSTIAGILGVSVDYLLGRTDDPNPPKPRLPDELQALLDKQEHEHVLYMLSAGGRNQQMVILSDEEYDWLQATLKTYREQKEKSENQEK